MKYISIKGGCQRWSVGKTSLYKLLNAGLIIAVRFGARTLIDVETGDFHFASLPRFSEEKTHASEIQNSHE